MGIEKELTCGHELSEEEKRAIHDPRDYPVISLIDGLSPSDMDEIYKAIRIKQEFQSGYIILEKSWIRDSLYFWVENHLKNHKPEDIAGFTEELIKGPLIKRYRLYFALKHPSKIETSENKKLTTLLLQAAHLNHP